MIIACLLLHISFIIQIIRNVKPKWKRGMKMDFDYQAKLPYYIVATAPSMDGYASKGAAMI